MTSSCFVVWFDFDTAKVFEICESLLLIVNCRVPVVGSGRLIVGCQCLSFLIVGFLMLCVECGVGCSLSVINVVDCC